MSEQKRSADTELAKVSSPQNSFSIPEFESRNLSAARKFGTEIAASREAQEVQVAMFAAKKFPRDEITAYNRILEDCQRMSLSEKAMYEYPRGGQVITGPSIHLARTLAKRWGNIDSGFKVLDQTSMESTVMAYCWDLETNYRETKVFTVKHVRETKKGSFPLTDSRDIYELIANQAARRERSCILSVIPGDVVDAAIGQCNVTLETGEGKMPLVDKVRILVKNFSEQYGVTCEMLESYIGCKKEAFSHQSVIRLKNVYNALRDGSSTVEQYFDVSLAQKNNLNDFKDQKEAEQLTESSAPVSELSGMTVDESTGEVKLGDL